MSNTDPKRTTISVTESQKQTIEEALPDDKSFGEFVTETVEAWESGETTEIQKVVPYKEVVQDLRKPLQQAVKKAVEENAYR